MEFGYINSHVCGVCLQRAYFLPGTAVSPSSYVLSPYILPVILRGSLFTVPTVQGKQ